MGHEAEPQPKSNGLRVLEMLGDAYAAMCDRPTGYLIDGQDCTVETYLNRSQHTATLVNALAGYEDDPVAYAPIKPMREELLTNIRGALNFYMGDPNESSR